MRLKVGYFITQFISMRLFAEKPCIPVLPGYCYSKHMKCLLLLLSMFISLSAQAEAGKTAMVVAAQPLAAQAGMKMLEKGGNAFDAAAATALALGVVEPGSSGIGGGGFFLLYIAKEKRYVMIDARETAPALAGNGSVYRTHSSINGAQSAGVPGLIAGVDHLVTRYGALSRQQVVKPAIKLARDGFRIGSRLQGMLDWRGKVFNDAAKRIFLAGNDIKQPGLADTLSRFGKYGADDFYRGETAKHLIRDMRKDGGLIRPADLDHYQAIERQPVQFDYQGFHFITASLPSSGGLTLAHIFGQLKNDDLKSLSPADRDHLLIEAMKRAYRDRNAHLGDADFVTIPGDYLAASRLQKLRDSIHMDKATPSEQLTGFAEPIGASVDTTHFSIVDKAGNMVSATLSINYGFGSGYVSPSTGILLNDEMDDFATRPGQPNAYGLVQGKANAVAPGKRMLSSMTPSFIIGPQRILIVGTPGGSRIISMVLLTSIGFMLNETAAADWVNAPRFHHQFLPDVVQYEKNAFSPEIAEKLKKEGHILKQTPRAYGNMQAIVVNRKTGKLIGISDYRGEGSVFSLPESK